MEVELYVSYNLAPNRGKLSPRYLLKRRLGWPPNVSVHNRRNKVPVHDNNRIPFAQELITHLLNCIVWSQMLFFYCF